MIQAISLIEPKKLLNIRNHSGYGVGLDGAGLIGAIGKISAFRSQGSQFDPRLCRDLN